MEKTILKEHVMSRNVLLWGRGVASMNGRHPLHSLLSLKIINKRKNEK